eukprot:TRINITY_DN122312_c0_g1_i1.p1 TRINITY_DN122312_c0_g1~~TRINITY_DN122312_c0_g1_i1.p1  ORF type:complete len:610 (+),score=155.90 TRINITY_DN122312_c0_g1_i1:140-1969(+)
MATPEPHASPRPTPPQTPQKLNPKIRLSLPERKLLAAYNQKGKVAPVPFSRRAQQAARKTCLEPRSQQTYKDVDDATWQADTCDKLDEAWGFSKTAKKRILSAALKPNGGNGLLGAVVLQHDQAQELGVQLERELQKFEDAMRRVELRNYEMKKWKGCALVPREVCERRLDMRTTFHAEHTDPEKDNESGHGVIARDTTAKKLQEERRHIDERCEEFAGRVADGEVLWTALEAGKAEVHGSLSVQHRRQRCTLMTTMRGAHVPEPPTQLIERVIPLLPILESGIASRPPTAPVLTDVVSESPRMSPLEQSALSALARPSTAPSAYATTGITAPALAGERDLQQLDVWSRLHESAEKFCASSEAAMKVASRCMEQATAEVVTSMTARIAELRYLKREVEKQVRECETTVVAVDRTWAATRRERLNMHPPIKMIKGQIATWHNRERSSPNSSLSDIDSLLPEAVVGQEMKEQLAAMEKEEEMVARRQRQEERCSRGLRSARKALLAQRTRLSVELRMEEQCLRVTQQSVATKKAKAAVSRGAQSKSRGGTQPQADKGRQQHTPSPDLPSGRSSPGSTIPGQRVMHLGDRDSRPASAARSSPLSARGEVAEA